MSRFTEQLILALQERDRSSQYFVYVNETGRQGGFRDSANIRFYASRLPASKPLVRILWEQLVLPELAAMHRLDVLHCPVNVQPLAAPCRTALTIHDLTFMLFPERFKRERQAYLAAFTRVSARRARRIMTDSANTKDDVSRLLKVHPEKIEVVYPGLDPSFYPRTADAINAFRERQGLPERFILYVGTLEPRKNVDRLIQAYALLIKRGLKSCPLVVAGARGWMTDRIFGEIEALGVADQVHFPGYVDRADLPLWYGAATLFVYPSLYEGFGLPLLEAMACGTPVVTSNVSSLPEVVGDAGVMVDPYRADELAEAIGEVLQSHQKRDAMAQNGLRQAAQFSWARAADQAKAIYRQVAQST